MKWRPKVKCRCLRCNWTGKRAIVSKLCPQCDGRVWRGLGEPEKASMPRDEEIAWHRDGHA